MKQAPPINPAMAGWLAVCIQVVCSGLVGCWWLWSTPIRTAASDKAATLAFPRLYTVQNEGFFLSFFLIYSNSFWGSNDASSLAQKGALRQESGRPALENQSSSSGFRLQKFLGWPQRDGCCPMPWSCPKSRENKNCRCELLILSTGLAGLEVSKGKSRRVGEVGCRKEKAGRQFSATD